MNKLLSGDDMKRYGYHKILVVITLLLLFLNGCKTDTSTHKYQIGLGPWVGFGPLYLAKEKGYFKEEGIDVDLIVLTGIAERNSALKSGKLDGLAAPVDYFVLSSGNGVDTRIVMAIDESVGGDGIVVKKSIKQFSDLRGKKIAFQRGLPSEFFLRALLKQNGIRLEELKYIDMETAQGGAAFITGQVDAAVLWEPWLSKACEQGDGYVLASTREYSNLIVDCIAFSNTTLNNSPQDVAKIVKAIFKAIDYYKHNPEEGNRIMAPYFQLDPIKFATVLSGAKFTDLKRNQLYFGNSEKPGPIFDVAKRASQIWYESKMINFQVNPDDMISVKFMSYKEK